MMMQAMFRKLSPVVIATGVFFSAMPALAQDAKTVLTESAGAIKKLKSVEYRCEQVGLGILKGQMDGTGHVKALRSPMGTKRSPQKYEGSITTMRTPLLQYLVGTDGRTTTWVNREDALVLLRANTDRQAQAELTKGQQISMTVFLEPNPFAAEMKDTTVLELKADATVRGVPCHVISATLEGGRISEWAIGIDDHLPRSVKMLSGSGDNPFGMSREIWELKTDTLKLADVTVTPPAGFRLDGQAPVDDKNGIPTSKASTAVKVGNAMPQFSLQLTNGSTVDNSSLTGTSVVLFWSAWSEEGIKALAALEQMSASGTTVMAMSYHELDDDAPAAHVNATGLKVSVALKADNLGAALGIRGVPTTVVVDANGRVVGAVEGFTTAADYVQSIQAIIKSVGSKN